MDHSRKMKQMTLQGFLVASVLLTACAAEYDIDRKIQDISSTPAAQGSEDTPPNLDAECTHKVIVQVSAVEVGLQSSTSNRFQCAKPPISQPPMEVDLCELSKDFLVVAERDLRVKWTLGSLLSSVRLTLNINQPEHRVVLSNGQKLCDLKTLNTPNAIIILNAVPSIKITTSDIIKFDFSESEVFKQIDKDTCQMNPIPSFNLHL